jgi:FAD/FMN-containing dehydrogenase
MTSIEVEKSGMPSMPDEAAIEKWKSGLRGKLLQPGGDGYEAARHIFNGSIDRRPAFIVQCAGVADVISAVNFAREHGLTVSMRGGGHGVTGAAVCEGGVMIDLSEMKGIRVDPSRQTVRVEPGVLTGELDHEAQAFGMATPVGICSVTGIAGVTLGGGIGWLGRKYGLTIDNLLSADVVTADGKLLTASESENDDLFWAIRGGGGNFGVLTSLEYKVHQVGPIVVGGIALYPMEQAHGVLRFYRDFAASAPDELSAGVLFMPAPPAPFVPPHLHGVRMVGIAGCYSGSIEDGMRATAPLRAFGTPAAQMVGPMPYLVLQRLADAGMVPGSLMYNRGHYLKDMGDECIDTLVTGASQAPSLGCLIIIRHLEGAIGRVSPDATAYSGRSAPYSLEILTEWPDAADTERHTTWVRDYWQALDRHTTGTVYVNFLGDEGDEWIARAYSPATYQRLAAVKRKYDPNNFFHLGQNIKPAAGG